MRGWLFSGIGCVFVGSVITSVGCRDGQVDVLVDIAGSSGGTTSYGEELPPDDGETPLDPAGSGGTRVDVDPLDGEGGTLPSSTGGVRSTGGRSASGGTTGSGGTTSGGSTSGGAGSGGTSGMDGGTSGGEAPGGADAGGAGGGAGAGGAAGDGGTGNTGSEAGGTSGISGVAGSGCGNFVVEAPEECDPPLSPGCSATCTKDACRLCEEDEAKCPAIAAADNRLFTFCEQLTGNAFAGPKAGIPKAQLCLDVLRCARANQCAGAVSPEACYCGDVEDLAQCFAPSAVATGECVDEFEGAAESTLPPDVSARFESENFALGVAIKLLKCDGEVCLSECVPTP